MKFDNDLVLCECDLDPLKAFVSELESHHQIEIIQQPGICLTMIRAEDSLEHQEFYLGEALTTECEVSVDGTPGIGLCIGEDPVRGYCIAVIDGIMRASNGNHPDTLSFIDQQRTLLDRRESEEESLVMKTRVDFKLMEQD